MVCWQTYISALDEDLGKAQARMDGILSADGASTSKQNEMLKAAAKQVGLCVCVCVCVCVFPAFLAGFSMCLHKHDITSSTLEPDASTPLAPLQFCTARVLAAQRHHPAADAAGILLHA